MDTTPPTVSAISAPNVKIGGGTSFTFTVTYSDKVAVNVSTLGNSNIVVTGPGGFSQDATLVSASSTTNATSVTATYRIIPRGGIWSKTGNGKYTIVINQGQVTDTGGNPMAAGTLGTFTVNAVPDKIAPTATLAAANVNAAGAGATSYTFTVTYADNVEVKVSSIDSSNIVVTGPNKFRQAATLVSVSQDTNGTPRTATYQITTPGWGTPKANNGVYSVVLQSKQVTDTSGNAVKSGTLGTFIVDTTPPTASLTAANVTKTGASSYTFTVTYADAVAINVSTIGKVNAPSNILVTGPGGYSQSAILVKVSSSSNGTPRTATYRITPPGKTWTAANNGAYTITMLSKQVTDTAGNPVAGAALGTFTVAVQAGVLRSPAVAISDPLGGGTASTSENSQSVPAAISNAVNEKGSTVALDAALPSEGRFPRGGTVLARLTNGLTIDAALRALLLDESNATGKPRPLFETLIARVGVPASAGVAALADSGP